MYNLHHVVIDSLDGRFVNGDLNQLTEEVIAFVINQSESREVNNFDFPDRFHSEFGIFKHFYFRDVFLRKKCSRTTY